MIIKDKDQIKIVLLDKGCITEIGDFKSATFSLKNALIDIAEHLDTSEVTTLTINISTQ